MKAIKLLAIVALVALTSNVQAQKQTADVKVSTIKWTGTKVVGSSHYGFIGLKEGSLDIKKGNIRSGSFVVDMASISVTDIENEEYNKKLVGHLLSDDFFGVEKFPTAQIEITKASKFVDGKSTVNGQLSIKGQTHPIEFVVNKGETYQAKIEIDRTLYGIRYGSGSFFDNLGDKAIDNVFTLDVNLVVE